MAVFSPHYWDLLGLSWVLKMFQMDLWMANSIGYTFHAAVTTWGFPRLAQQTFSKPSRIEVLMEHPGATCFGMSSNLQNCHIYRYQNSWGFRLGLQKKSKQPHGIHGLGCEWM